MKIENLKAEDSIAVADFILGIQNLEFSLNIQLHEQTDLLHLTEFYTDGGFWIFNDMFSLLNQNEGIIEKIIGILLVLHISILSQSPAVAAYFPVKMPYKVCFTPGKTAPKW